MYQPVGPDSAHHNVISATVLDGDLDEAALRHSLDSIVRRHEVLRVGVVRRDGSWVQVVDPDGTWPMTAVDLRTLDGPAREQRLRRTIGDEEHRPFTLATGPLVRATLVRTAPAQHVLLLVMHHIVIDPWGTRSLSGSSPSCTRPGARTASRNCPTCRCRSPTSAPGSTAGWTAGRSTSTSPTGGGP